MNHHSASPLEAHTLLALCLVTIPLGLALFFPLPSPIYANAITVNTTVDDNSPNDNCTLREAILAANTNAAVDACAVGALGLDTISFGASVTGTIVLSSTLGSLAITDTLTINGPGASLLTISGNNATRVMLVASGVAMNLSNVTISNGNAASFSGGGIWNDGGTLSITGTTFYSNTTSGSGGGIYNNGTLTITNSSVYSNSAPSGGGGIYNASGFTLTVVNSALAGNTASGNPGGGIYNDGGTATIANSSFYSNTAGTSGGGIYGSKLNISNSTFYSNSAMWGGGVHSGVASTVTNSTLISNTAAFGGGIYVFFGTAVTITNSTLAGNSATSSGGGIFNSGGTATLRNTIVANNPSGGDCSGTLITNDGNNIDSGITCGWGSSNGSMSSTDPKLAPLSNYGGSTQTMALRPDSPAIEAGSNTNCPTTDQRGITRPRDGDVNGSAVCDIGAFEVAPIVVTTVSDVANGTDGFCSLREAIVAANTNAASGELAGECPPGLPWMDGIWLDVSGTITLASALANITQDLTINGPSTASLTISGNNAVRVLLVSPGVAVNIANITIANGNATGGLGGGISSNGTLNITNTTFYSNTATSGGAIYNPGTMMITNTTIYGNRATGSPVNGGGGIYNIGTLTLTNSTLAGNTAPSGLGGGIRRATGTIALRNTIVANNTASSGANCSGTITNGGNNLDSGTTCGWGSSSGSMSGIDPKLAPLANYDGPTQTMPLFVGSLAIDAGSNSFCPDTDQRGVTRPINVTCDIGAVEGTFYPLYLPLILK